MSETATVSGNVPPATATPPTNAGNPPANGGGGNNPTPDFRQTIPEAYREKNYLRDVKSTDDLFKMLDNAQTLIGKQGKGIPAADASKEDWDKFYAELGRPDSADKYEFERPEGSQIDENADKVVKGIFHEAGLSPKQAKLIQSKYEGFIKETLAQNETKINQEFDAFAKEVFGDKVDQELSSSQQLLAQLVPESAKKYLSGIDNKSAIILASVMKEVRAKYLNEDSTRMSGGGGNNVPASNDEIRAEARKLMNSPEYKDPFHPSHDSVKARIDELYKKIK